MYDVISLRELLVDFIQCGINQNNNPIFKLNPGGAPSNVLAMLSKLGHKTAFIGKVRNDYLGNILGKMCDVKITHLRL